jgi:hypothetical protein
MDARARNKKQKRREDKESGVAKGTPQCDRWNYCFKEFCVCVCAVVSFALGREKQIVCSMYLIALFYGGQVLLLGKVHVKFSINFPLLDTIFTRKTFVCIDFSCFIA